MTSSEFKVFFPRKEVFFCTLIVYALFAFSFYMIFDDPVNLTPTIILAVCFFIIGTVFALPGTLFCVKVTGSEIAVRTRLGQHYRFKCSDIKKVTIYHRIGRYGLQYRIIISLKAKTLGLEWSLINFEKMAAYILEKYASKEIKKSAISPSCIRDLLGLSKKRLRYISETPNI